MLIIGESTIDKSAFSYQKGWQPYKDQFLDLSDVQDSISCDLNHVRI